MTEIIWHGRGGQGAFTASRILGASYCLSDSSKYSIAFPTFGPERRGAPIKAFTKLDSQPIGNRSQVQKADYVIFLDDTLFSPAAFEELKPNGRILLNTRQNFNDDRIIQFDGDSLAMQILRLPVTNTIMLGIFAAVSNAVSLTDLQLGIKNTMAPKLYEKNALVVESAYTQIKEQLEKTEAQK